MRSFNCKKCGLKVESESVQIVDGTKLGWDFVWDISNGLDLAWYCPICKVPLHTAIELLTDALGSLDLGYASLSRFRRK